ncbi:MAG: asparagine synthase (glutamine-hydrolyzing) [Acidobacteriota bacterium]
MCGIAGIVSLAQDGVNNESLRAMSGVMIHRGPDGDGLWTDSRVGLAHLRLAIIDLSSGDQPMVDESGSLVVVFNGEIYNFQDLRAELSGRGRVFRTNSDTEVLLHGYHEWGRELVNRLNGMFAFAIYDRQQGRVFIARDRLGVKPLYYFQDRRHFAFASELGGLMASGLVPREIDQTALDLYLHYQYIPPPYTIYRQARKLEPGSWLEIDLNLGQTARSTYWDIQTTRHVDESRSFNDWIAELEDLVEDAVRIRLISDVPFGAFLSGGTDSGLIVAKMSALMTGPVRTFSIGLADQEKDELPYARQVAGRYQTEHHEFRVAHEGLLLIPELCRFFGEPFADSSAVPTFYVSKLAREKVKMVLTGDGGDEMFAGYRRYAHLLQQLAGGATADRFVSAHGGGRFGGWSNWRGMLRRVRHADKEVGRWLARLAGRPAWPGYFDHLMSHFSQQERRVLLGRRATLSDETFFTEAFPFAAADSVTMRAQYVDVKTYLPGDILVKVDRMSMANSLEVRSPLLDYRIAEMAFRMPTRFKLPEVELDGRRSKFILKELAARHLGADYVYRPKEGFEIPVDCWLREDRDGYLRDNLLAGSSPIYDHLDRQLIHRLVTEHREGRFDNGAKLWNLLMLDGWFRSVHRKSDGWRSV